MFGGRITGMKQTFFSLCLILFALPSWGQTTFSGGNISGGSVNAISYKTINWGSTENHGLSTEQKWSQNTKDKFSRLGGTSHRFELRAGDCGSDDCERGSYKGAFGRVEAYLNNPLSSNYLGEDGERWYAWSFYIDGTHIKPKIDGHLMQFGQFKLSYSSKVLGRKYKHCKQYSEVVLIFKYKPEKKGLGLSREICREDAIYESEYNIVIPKDKLFNVWHDMVIHAKWGEEGFLKLFVNGELKYSEIGYITPKFTVPNKKNKFAGPSFRYGIYVNKVPKNFNGKIIAFYDEIARAKKCTDSKFSNLQKKLGYSCKTLKDNDGIVIRPKYVKCPDCE